MTVVINGTTGISPVTASGTSATIDGMTVGRGAGEVSTNTAVGASALAANITGNQNVAVGYSAGALTTGSQGLTYVGYQAGNSNLTGSRNTAIGWNAGYTDTTSFNVFVGSRAGYLANGGANTAVGDYALSSVTGASTGSNNVAMGQGTLQYNTSGSYNTGLGTNALAANSTSSQNTAVGYQAAYSSTTGFGDLVAHGFKALYSNTTGYSNTALGSMALYSNTTAIKGTAIGYQAGYTNTTSNYNTFIGAGAGYTSNATGTTSAANTCVGHETGYSMTTGVGNCFVGPGNGSVSNAAGYAMTTGSLNTILGGFTGNQGGLDIRTASNYIVLSDGAGNPRGILNSTSVAFPNIYTQTTANAASVYVYADGTLARSTSALKYKQDIRDLEAMDISGLRPVRYKSKCEGDDQTKDHLGLIADEAAEAGFEELVTRGANGEVEGFQYERLTVVLLKELQTLRARVAQLEGK